MISMSIIHSIRRMRKEGSSIAAIARELSISEPTVRKYLHMRDLSAKPPVRKTRKSVIDQYVPQIEQWLAEDRDLWSKQRHTATPVHRRLVEKGAEISLSTVTRKVGELKREYGLERERGFLDLSWHEAEAQADFGQTDVYWRGVRTRMHFFVLLFPYSNAAVACLTAGENAECTCQALRDLFERLGGVPRRIVFDNAAGVGRLDRSGGTRYTELSGRFCAHYGFESYSGHEKGKVESKVGAIRRSLFVPVPKAWTLDGFNADLFERCMGMADKPHYRKGDREADLFERDRAALLPLPDTPMDVAAYKRMKADKYGIVVLERCHRYLAGPGHAGRELIVGLRAGSVEILDGGRILHRGARTRLRGPSHQQRGPARPARDAVREGERVAQQQGPGRAARRVGVLVRHAGTHRTAGPLAHPAFRQPGQRLGQRGQGHERRGRRHGRHRPGRRRAAGRAPRRRAGAHRIRRTRRTGRIRHRVRPRHGGRSIIMRTGDDVERLRADARSLSVSRATIDDALSWATPRQVEAISRMLRTELDNRETSKRERLLRRARFPVMKSLDGYDRVPRAPARRVHQGRARLPRVPGPRSG